MLGAARKTAGGGTLKDLNLCGNWSSKPWGSGTITWEPNGHSVRFRRDATVSGWDAANCGIVLLPAGTYSVRAYGLSFGVSCEFRDVGKDVNLGYLGDYWTKVTFDQPTRVNPRLAWSPKWTGEGTVTTVILEGDWGGVSL